MAEGLARKGFDIDLRYGQLAEGDAAKLLAMRGPRIEVKTDDWLRQTDNLAIEVATRSRDRQREWFSGITTTEAEWWWFKFGEHRHLVLETGVIKRLVDEAIAESRWGWVGDNQRFKCALVPMEWIVRPWPVVVRNGAAAQRTLPTYRDRTKPRLRG